MIRYKVLYLLSILKLFYNFCLTQSKFKNIFTWTLLIIIRDIKLFLESFQTHKSFYENDFQILNFFQAASNSRSLYIYLIENSIDLFIKHAVLFAYFSHFPKIKSVKSYCNFQIFFDSDYLRIKWVIIQVKMEVMEFQTV